MSEKEANTVFIGRKPTMSYVMAVITNFNSGDTKEVVLKARGRAITTAVNVAQVITRRFMKDLKVSKIGIGTEEVTPREGGDPRKVSTMEIVLTKP
ncbi:MAG TPA: DNA-binding protein Alba [Candidatus Bathyarchaeota archaeon]|nr:MAG: DNA-binding protein Alba [Candidatus Bathyarchaeota archaeon]HDI07757.1 DNA-binding protein Alba [Candidatus Bathyarchaeota archaeon]